MLKMLVNPSVSVASARLLNSPLSRPLIPLFVRKNNINMSYYIVPAGGYRSFNDFFTRRMEEDFIRFEGGELVSPCDGLLTVSEIDQNSIFRIKHSEYSLKELLKSEDIARRFTGGRAYVFRLTPAHYHRYIWTTDGTVCEEKTIRGVLHSVQPVCHEKTKVFIQNTREYAIISNPKLGEVVQMEIGALLVGKISNHGIEKYRHVSAGEEKGFFEYGGSTIVVLTKSCGELPEEIRERDRIGTEIPVLIGERLIY